MFERCYLSARPICLCPLCRGKLPTERSTVRKFELSKPFHNFARIDCIYCSGTVWVCLEQIYRKYRINSKDQSIEGQTLRLNKFLHETSIVITKNLSTVLWKTLIPYTKLRYLLVPWKQLFL